MQMHCFVKELIVGLHVATQVLNDWTPCKHSRWRDTGGMCGLSIERTGEL